MKAIRVKNEEEFERLRHRIDSEASHARDHWSLLSKLYASSREFWNEMHLSNTFWHLTFIAHSDAVLSHLCRLYDKHDGALSLGRFLLTVRSNRQFFSDAAFRERLKGNPYIDTLVQDRRIDDAELDGELSSVSKADPLVVKLWRLRDTVISHTDAEKVRTSSERTFQRWLPPDDVETLLSRAQGITRRYSLLYSASVSGGLVGIDDYTDMLEYVRETIAAREAIIERQIEGLKQAGVAVWSDLCERAVHETAHHR